MNASSNIDFMVITFHWPCMWLQMTSICNSIHEASCENGGWSESSFQNLNLCKQPQLWSVYTAPLNEGHPQSAMTSWVIVLLNSWRLKKTLVVKITSRVIQKRLVARLNWFADIWFSICQQRVDCCSVGGKWDLGRKGAVNNVGSSSLFFVWSRLQWSKNLGSYGDLPVRSN